MLFKSSLHAAMVALAVSGIVSAIPTLTPAADKSAAKHDADYMVLFYKNWDFFGDEDEETAIESGLAWPGQGNWDTCYQLVPDWQGQVVGSVKLSPAAQNCWFYEKGNTNCAGTIPNEDFWPVDAAGPGSVAQETDFGDYVGSWVCSPWTT